MFVNIGTNDNLTTCFGKSQGYLSADAARGLKDSSQRGLIMAWVQLLGVFSLTKFHVFRYTNTLQDVCNDDDKLGEVNHKPHAYRRNGLNLRFSSRVVKR